MRRLLLVRHAKADALSGGGDRERPLTGRGEKDAARLGRYLAKERLLPDFAVASDARRAKRTLHLLLDAHPGRVAHVFDTRIYLAPAEQLLEMLRETPDTVSTLLAVGHNPGFSDLAILLAGAGVAGDLARLRAGYPAAALAVFDFDVGRWSGVRRGGGRLDRFVTPDALGE